MNAQEKTSRVDFITRLLLEDLSPDHAKTLLARLHNQLPPEGEGITEVLNEVHEKLHATAAAWYENNPNSA